MNQTPSSLVEEFHTLLRPLLEYKPWSEIKRSYPLARVELLRLHEWYGGFEQLRSMVPDEQETLNQIIEAYQQTRTAFLALPYKQRVILVDRQNDRYGQWIVSALVEMSDWEPEDLLRWSRVDQEMKDWGSFLRRWMRLQRTDTRPPFPFAHILGAAARRQDLWGDSYLEKYVQKGMSSKRIEDRLVGMKAWLHLVAYGRRPVDAISKDLRTSLRSQLSEKSAWYFPQEARRFLDPALLQELTSRPLDREGERLLQNLGPLYANELVQPILDRVHGDWYAQQALRTLKVQMNPELDRQLRQIAADTRILSAEHHLHESLFEAIVQSFDEPDEAKVLLSFLRRPAIYPPTQRVPVITSQQLLEALHKIGGEPGEPDQYIIPEYITRQARLVLATNAYYATADLLATVYKIYDKLNTTYVRHDVLLCTFLHPAISQQEKHQLVIALRAVLQAKGRASRHTKPGHKFNTYVRWAIKYGYLDERPYEFLR